MPSKKWILPKKAVAKPTIIRGAMTKETARLDNGATTDISRNVKKIIGTVKSEAARDGQSSPKKGQGRVIFGLFRSINPNVAPYDSLNDIVLSHSNQKIPVNIALKKRRRRGIVERRYRIAMCARTPMMPARITGGAGPTNQINKMIVIIVNSVEIFLEAKLVTDVTIAARSVIFVPDRTTR